jgi:hypothetical protein
MTQGILVTPEYAAPQCFLTADGHINRAPGHAEAVGAHDERELDIAAPRSPFGSAIGAHRA